MAPTRNHEEGYCLLRKELPAMGWKALLVIQGQVNVKQAGKHCGFTNSDKSVKLLGTLDHEEEQLCLSQTELQ